MNDGADDNNNNDNKQTLSKYLTVCPALVLSLECVYVCVLILTSALWDKYSYFPHFVFEKNWTWPK